MGRRVRGSGFVGVLALLATVALLPAPVPGAVSLAPSSASEAEPAVAQDALEEARAHLRTGRYEEAEAAFAAILSGSSAAPPSAPSAALRTAAHEGLFLARMAVGRHAEAEAAARAGEAEVGAALSVRLGEALLARGRLDEAEAAFRRGAADGAPDRLMALHHLAALEEERGNREAALGGFDAFIDLYNAGAARTARELVAVGLAVQALGAGDPDLFRDALRAFDEAAAADPRDPEPALRAGALFLSRYNGADARASFEEVLATNPRHPRALVGRARALETSRQGGAMAAVEAALEVNPRMVEALVFRGGSLRRARAVADRAGEGRKRALEVNPASLEALALLASVRRRQGTRPASKRPGIGRLAINPRYSGLYVARGPRPTNPGAMPMPWPSPARGWPWTRPTGRPGDSWGSTSSGWVGWRKGAGSSSGPSPGSRTMWGSRTRWTSWTPWSASWRSPPGPFILVREDEADLLAPLVAELADEAWGVLLAGTG
jgi:tetratricopeptide (TPR) repeat protein